MRPLHGGRRRPFTRVSPTAETREKISIGVTVSMTPERRAAISRVHKGKTLAPEHIQALHHPLVKGECVYCGGPATERDHVVPRCLLPRGETVLACHHCNDSKGQRTPDEWFAAGLEAT